MGIRWRKILYRLHRWFGVHLGFVVFVVCLTGSVAVLGHEWDWLADPAWRAESTEVSWEEVGATLREKLPEHRVSHVSGPVEPGFAARALLKAPSGQLQFALFEPATGELQGVRNALTIRAFLRHFHKRLFLPNGIYFTGVLAAVLAFSTLSGLLVFRRFWKHLLRFRVGERPSVRWADLHRTVGVWTSVFGLVIAATGIWYLVELGVHDSGGTIEPQSPELSEARLVELAADRKPRPLGEVVDAARRALPNLRVRKVRFPRTANAPFRIEGQMDALLVRPRANRVYVEPYNLEVLAAQRAGELTALQRWSDMADELHFGTLGTTGGLWSKFLYVFFGLALSIAILAGPVLALQRGEGRRGSSRLGWGDLASGAATSLVVVACVAAAYATYHRPVVQGREVPSRVSPPVEVAGTEAVVARQDDEGPTRYTVRWRGPRPADLKDVSLELAGNRAISLRGWRRPHGWGAAAGEAELVVERHGAGPASAEVAFERRNSDAVQWRRLPPSRYVRVAAVALLALLAAAAILWLVWLWRPAARSIRD